MGVTMQQSVVLVFDCGATNIRAIAIDRRGKTVAHVTTANSSEVSAENPLWQQWSLDAIMRRIAYCCQKLNPLLVQYKIEAICVTTFGVDGTLVDNKGQLLYPIISWKCSRTSEMIAQLQAYISDDELQCISGVGKFSFNTIYKLLWLKQYHPAILKRAHCWLFISSLINQRFCGEFTTDVTMAGTSQLMDLQKRCFSDRILALTGISSELFPPLAEPGQKIGKLRHSMAKILGLPSGIPVISCGHDTQFSLFGIGAEINQAVLSSGTWEILMVRSQNVKTTLLSRHPGITCEPDSLNGLYNPGMQWLSSGILEWIRRLFWQQSTSWNEIINEATAIPAGCEGIRLQGDLLNAKTLAGWTGVTINSERGHFYRSALEALAVQLRDNLHCLEHIAGFTANELLLAGGGSRNKLWNQIKADILQLPVKVPENTETTALGAAMYGWQGAGFAKTANEARRHVEYHYHYFYPNPETIKTNRKY